MSEKTTTTTTIDKNDDESDEIRCCTCKECLNDTGNFCCNAACIIS